MSLVMEDNDFLELISTIDPGNGMIPAENNLHSLGGDDVDIDLLNWESGSQASSSSFDSDVTDDSQASKRSKEEVKLQKNREAATRCRQKRKQEQQEVKTAVVDLENQLHKVKNDNMALQLENASLRTENRSLKDTLAKVTKDNNGAVTGVVAFGIVCLFPIFSSASTLSSAQSQSSEFMMSVLLSASSMLGLANPVGGEGVGAVEDMDIMPVTDGVSDLLSPSGGTILTLLLAVVAAVVVISFLLGAGNSSPASKLPSVVVAVAQPQPAAVKDEVGVSVSAGKVNIAAAEGVTSTGSVTLDAARGQVQQWTTRLLKYKEILPF